MQVSGLFIYPIKALGGIELQEAIIDQRGIKYDRRWMLIDHEGKFLTQRSLPTMALLKTSFVGNYLQVEHILQSFPVLKIPISPRTTNSNLTVQIWGDQCIALVYGQNINDWFSMVLNFPCRLVYMPDDSYRPVNPKYGQAGDIVSFADSGPFLILGTASLEDLNNRLPEAVPMNRFRPNIVFSGGQPFTEDSWKLFQIGQVSFRGLKLCARCMVPTINQNTAEKGKEPLKTLSQYRQENGKVNFGINAVWNLKDSNTTLPRIRVGDKIEVSSYK